MSGLDRIIEQINADAERVCADIRSNCDCRCNEIINIATAEAEKIAEVANEEAKLYVSRIISKAESSALFEKRTVLLKAKQQIIKDYLKESLEYICNLSDEQYFDLILKIISQLNAKKSGEMFFSQKDLLRLPDGIKKKINGFFENGITVSNTPANIIGGFILKCGLIEINCSLDALFDSKRDMLIDELSAFLFGERNQIEN